MSNISKEDLRERLSALSHDQWSGWMEWMFQEIEKEVAASVTQPNFHHPFMLTLENLKCIKRWKRQMVTEYSDLSEKEKDSDRKEADRMIKVFEGESS